MFLEMKMELKSIVPYFAGLLIICFLVYLRITSYLSETQFIRVLVPILMALGLYKVRKWLKEFLP